MVLTRGSVVSDQSMDISSYKVYTTFGTFPVPELPTVRRQLFGFTDKPQTVEQLQDFTERTAKSCQDWNFDFIKECPLTGRFLWHRVRARDVPAFYNESRRSNLNACLQQHDTESDIEDFCESFQESTEHFSAEEKEHEEVQQSISKKPRLVQTTMRDYTRIQKRRSSVRLQMKHVSSHKMRRYRYRNKNVSMLL